MPFQEQGKGSVAKVLIKNEGKKHRDAFEYYYHLGPERAYTKVAAKFSVSAHTVYLWSNSFKWLDRVITRDSLIRTKVDEEVATLGAERLADWQDTSLELIEGYLSKAKSWIDDPRRQLRPEDFERVMNVLMRLKRFDMEMSDNNNVYTPPTINILNNIVPAGPEQPRRLDQSSEVIEAEAIPVTGPDAQNTGDAVQPTSDQSVERDAG